MYSWLSNSLSNDGQVLTASRRLALELQRAHSDEQIASGLKAWPTPKIRYIDDWLAEQLVVRELSEALPVRIGGQSSTVLWEKAAARAGAADVAGFAGMIKQWRESWKRLQAGNVPLEEIESSAFGAEQRLFVKALRLYRAALSEKNWMDETATTPTVCNAIQNGFAALAGSVTFAGFDRMTPAQATLLRTIEDAGIDIVRIAAGTATSAVEIYRLHDSDAELRAAGAWARGLREAQPKARVAIICPDLEQRADSTARLVREGFAPGWQYGGLAYQQSVNVSYGRSLAEYPMVSVALLALRWLHQGLDSGQVSVLLRSPFMGGSALSGRSRLERELRWVPDRQWQPESLLAVLGRACDEADVEQWSRAVMAMASASAEWQDTHPPSVWAKRFDELLNDLAWPGNASLGSIEYQVVNRWRDLFNDMAQLDRVLGSISLAEAAGRLQSLASDTVFQAQADAEALPLLGMLEASGMEFDYVWVSGFDANQWPATGRPLAYVSRQLQEKFEMPDATPADTLQFSQNLLQHFLGSAAEVRFSWCELSDGIEQQISPLLDDIPAKNFAEVNAPHWHASEFLQRQSSHRLNENPVPPVAAGDQVYGGAYTVQRQRTDPFSAFAYARLAVSDLRPFQVGLSPSERGRILHNALSYLYADRPAQNEIRQWSDAEKDERISAAIERALRRYYIKADAVIRETTNLEALRDQKILQQFLQEELQREPFSIVSNEQDLQYVGFGVNLSLRADRIDRQESGDLLILDYKTGAEKSLLNREGDLNDIQLAVYAMSVDGIPGAVGGVGLINIDSRQISYKTSAAIDDWPATLGRWRAEAETAVQGIAAGDARVNMALTTDQGRPLNVLSRFEELRRER